MVRAVCVCVFKMANWGHAKVLRLLNKKKNLLVNERSPFSPLLAPSPPPEKVLNFFPF